MVCTDLRKFPTLYKKDSSGRVQFWDICVSKDEQGNGVITTSHGKMNGIPQNTEDVIKEGKNLGKVNATTPYEQALSEAESKWVKQQERKGYVQSLTEVDSDNRPGLEPMLAHRFDEHGHKISFPAFIQPKLDGHRCIAVIKKGKAELFSRKRAPITGVPHIIASLEQLFPEGNMCLDGELYNHDYKDNFEELTSFIRSKEPKAGHEVVQYHVYDFPYGSSPCDVRMHDLGVLSELLQPTVHRIAIVPTYKVATEDEAMTWFETFRSMGYEGAMIRNECGLYVGKRSYDLQKIKEFKDSEFQIIDVSEGRGKLTGHAIFTCKTQFKDQSTTFDVKLKGSQEQLKTYFENPSLVLGKMLTVQYQGLTNTGVPRFPVGLRIREE